MRSITVSMGVAIFPDNGSNRDIVLNAVDRALYQAKAEERDRVCVATASIGLHVVEAATRAN